jgi:hypothetical protein
MATKKQNIISKIFNDKSIQDYVNVFPNRVGSHRDTMHGVLILKI